MNLEENTKPDTKKAPETWTKKTIGEELCILLPQVIIIISLTFDPLTLIYPCNISP